MQTWRIRRPATLWGRLALALVLITALLAAFAGYDRYAESRLQAAYPPPGEFVTVGGARMHYICAGSGEPTLVLAAGVRPQDDPMGLDDFI